MQPNQTKKKSVRDVLLEVQWCYPPVDAFAGMGGSWNRPARCPVCFAEYNPERLHKTGCELKAAIDA